MQLRLALRLGLLFLASTILAVGALVYQTYYRADTLSERNLLGLANQLAEAVTTDAKGAPVLRLADHPGAIETTGYEKVLFIVREVNGRVIGADDAELADFAPNRPPANGKPQYFRIESYGAGDRDYYGLDVTLPSAVGPLWITLAQQSDADELVHSMLREFMFDVAWIIPIFVGVTLLVGIFALRGGLRPLREASAQAAAIDPSAMSLRLRTDHLPNEVLALVGAVNRALDRLEEGFAVQRRFTANAAHELRTPLTIITGALETMEGDGELAKLREDVARMNRLVDQLLRVARLDAISIDVSDEVDLGEIASEVVEYIAPLAIAQGCSIALTGATQQVIVRGNRYAIADALRNLVENAVAHTKRATEVVVDVNANGSVSVSDHGPGIPPEDRGHLFDRFWRGRSSRGGGAGLGLAIVKEIMKVHAGSVEYADSESGGARFTLRFRHRQN